MIEQNRPRPGTAEAEIEGKIGNDLSCVVLLRTGLFTGEGKGEARSANDDGNAEDND